MKLKQKIIGVLIWCLTKLDPSIVVVLPAVPVALRQTVQVVEQIQQVPGQRDVLFAMAAGGVGYWGNGYFNQNYWHENYWAEAGSEGSSPPPAGGVIGVTGITSVMGIT